tara:strand:- start:447 stop:1061 length:615 start_codon:yes stop_codon:yes gene_type:complete
MAIKLANNQSLTAITSLPSAVSGGTFTLLQTQTASSSATISFTSNIDSSYKEYMFKFYNMHPATDNTDFQFNASIDGGSNYNVSKTSAFYRAFNDEASGGGGQGVSYDTDGDSGNNTGFQVLTRTDLGNANDESCVGTLFIYNPSDTNLVKHYQARINVHHEADYTFDAFIGGYLNTTSAVNAFQFKMASGNTDSGVIKLYGVS